MRRRLRNLWDEDTAGRTELEHEADEARIAEQRRGRGEPPLEQQVHAHIERPIACGPDDVDEAGGAR
jgi:hypothetical protein